MNYSVPLCECGNKLIYTEGHSIEENYNINKNGKQSKKMIDRQYIANDFTVLRCEVCYVRYEVEWDEKGRVVRGEKY